MILAFVVPAILDGSAPLAVAIVGALAVMLCTVTLAHGWGPKSLAAMLGRALRCPCC
ncbi:MAG: YibE/F family protein [Solirubrobacterales bacterium]